MKYRIIRKIPRSSDDNEICKRLSVLGVATVSEVQNKQGVLVPEIRPILNDMAVSGTAITVKCFDADNLMLHAAIENIQNGDFLVVSTNQETRNGYFGELMATACKSRGASGLVIDGGVRDTSELKKIGFPVWSRYICVTGTTKCNPGWVNENIVCGGVLVKPGDYILADNDGVVVIDRASVNEVLKSAEERRDKEMITRKRLLSGESSLDIYDLRKKLEAIGVKYENTKEEVVR